MYAAQVEDGLVVQVIVGDAVWASNALGGFWVGSEELVGIGWIYLDGQLIAPPTPIAEPQPDDL